MMPVGARFGLVGAGGFGREVMPYLVASSDRAEHCFVELVVSQPIVNGVAVVLEEEFLRDVAATRFFNVAIDNGTLRRTVSERFNERGCLPRSIVAPNVVIGPGVELNDGAILCPFSMITANARVGKFFHANIYSYVAHDCVIGDYVTFAPGVMCNGNVVVEDFAYIGTGAVIKQGRPGAPLVIGRGAVVGMGAVVTKSVAAGTTVVGNPAQPIGRRPDKDLQPVEPR